MLAAAGDVTRAIAAATEASRLEPDNPLPMEELALIFADQGDATAWIRSRGRSPRALPDS